MSGGFKNPGARVILALLIPLGFSTISIGADFAGVDSDLASLAPPSSASNGSSGVMVRFTAMQSSGSVSSKIGSAGDSSSDFGWDSIPAGGNSQGFNPADIVSAPSDGTPPAVPLPSAFWSTIGTLAGLAIIYVVRRLRRRPV